MHQWRTEHRYLDGLGVKIAYIGEVGIDRYPGSDLEIQKGILHMAALFAIEWRIPLCLHTRGMQAWEETHQLLDNLTHSPAVYYHAFNGTTTDFKQIREWASRQKITFVLGCCPGVWQPRDYELRNPDTAFDLKDWVIESDAPYRQRFLCGKTVYDKTEINIAGKEGLNALSAALELAEHFRVDYGEVLKCTRQAA